MLLRRAIHLTAVCALPLALAACGQDAPSDPRTASPLVRTAVIGDGGTISRSFTGVVAARVQSDLGFRVPGKVLDRLVDTGEAVRRGQVLMRIDPVDLKLASHAQQEAVVAAKARAQQATQDESRYRELRGTGAVSESAYDQIKSVAEAAKAQLRAAEAQAQVARNESRYAELVADSDGVVMETLVEPGQVVSAGQVVVRVAHAGQREALVQLPETLRPAIGSTGYASLFGTHGASIPVRLRQLSDASDRLTRTFDARYVLEGDFARAPLGATVTISLPTEIGGGTQGVSVPIGSLYDAGKGPGVWLVSGRPTKVTWRPVAIQSIDDGNAKVTGALKKGDQIVALGAHLLRDQQEVRLSAPARATKGDAKS